MEVKKKMKKTTMLSLVTSVMLLTLACVGTVAYGEDFLLRGENYFDGIHTQSIIGVLVGALVGVVVAVSLIPTIANQTAVLEADDDNLSASEQQLVGLWPLLIIVGVMLAIIGIAM